MNVIFALPGKFFQKPSHHHLIFFVPATVIRSGSTCIITLSVCLASSQHHRIESNSCYFPGPTIEVRVTKLFFNHILNIYSPSEEETSRDVPLTTMLTLPT